jgi:hypothetical protein
LATRGKDQQCYQQATTSNKQHITMATATGYSSRPFPCPCTCSWTSRLRQQTYYKQRARAQSNTPPASPATLVFKSTHSMVHSNKRLLLKTSQPLAANPLALHCLLLPA